MTHPGRKVVRALVLAGCIVAAVTLLLFHQLSDASSRSETFCFTVWFVVFQEAVFFGTLAVRAFRSEADPTSVPVQIGYLTVVTLNAAIALVTVAVFNFVLVPLDWSPTTYRTAAVTETLLGVALLSVLQIVDVAHRSSHRRGGSIRSTVEDILDRCDRVRALTEANGWSLSPSLHELAERIRFSEGLRRSNDVLDEVSGQLDELENLASAGGDDSARSAAARLVQHISVAATRRA